MKKPKGTGKRGKPGGDQGGGGAGAADGGKQKPDVVMDKGVGKLGKGPRRCYECNEEGHIGAAVQSGRTALHKAARRDCPRAKEKEKECYGGSNGKDPCGGSLRQLGRAPEPKGCGAFRTSSRR